MCAEGMEPSGPSISFPFWSPSHFPVSILLNGPAAVFRSVLAAIQKAVGLNHSLRVKHAAEALVHLVLKGKQYSKHYLISKTDKNILTSYVSKVWWSVFTQRKENTVLCFSLGKWHLVIFIFFKKKVSIAVGGECCGNRKWVQTCR